MSKYAKSVLLVFIVGIFFYLFSQLQPRLGNLVITSPQSTIGYVDLQKALTSHPQAEAAIEILKKFQEEREEDLQAKVKGKELSPEERQKVNLLAQKYEQEIAEKDAELTRMLIKDIQKMAEKVAKNLNLTIILDRQAVVYGGVDITEDVIEKLKEELKAKKTPSNK